MQAPILAGKMMARSPVALGWLLFYGAVLAAWAGLVLMATESAALPALPADFPLRAFLVRCLGPVGGLEFQHLVAMWALMSLGMMLPTALPVLRRFAEILGGRAGAQATFLAFLSAYLAVWLGFSLLAAILQWLLAQGDLVDDAGRVRNAVLAASLFAFAGGYQFTRLKHACLTRCRHPMTFFMAHWRSGKAGAAAMGLRHGLDCLGCCWPLMLLAFVGGTMNLAWMGLAMVLMLVEKLAGAGRYVTAPLGVLLVIAAGFTLGEALQAI